MTHTPETMTLQEAYKQGFDVFLSAYQNASQWDRVDLFFDADKPKGEDPLDRDFYVAESLHLRATHLFERTTDTSASSSIAISRKQAESLYKDLKRIFDGPQPKN